MSTIPRIQNWRIDPDGMLRVTVHVLKEGVYPYGAGEWPAKKGHDHAQYIPAAEFTASHFSSIHGQISRPRRWLSLA